VRHADRDAAAACWLGYRHALVTVETCAMRAATIGVA
jgi:hypothetical protein